MRRSPLAVLLTIIAGFLAIAAHAQTAALVSDLNPGIFGDSSRPSDFTSVGGKLFFTAADPNGGRDLWRTDGTPAGTVWLAQICPSPCSQAHATLAGAGRLLFFDVVCGTDHQLWRTDGTRAGTSFLLADQPVGLTVAGDIAYFWAWLRHPPWSFQPWRSDGTAAGTAPLGALSLGKHDGTPRFAVLGSRVFVLARDPAGTAALWRCDHGLGAPVAVPHLSGGFRLLTSAGGRLFFLAGTGGGDGEELWSSDGTSAGMRRLTDFAPAEPFRLTRALAPGDRGVSFPADDGVHGLQMWTSDGTPAGTVQATAFTSADPFGGPEPGSAQAVEVAGRLFVIADGGAGFRLWVKTGRGFAVPLGHMEVSPFTGLLRIGGQVFFRADDGASGFEPWRSDGTAAGTRRLRDICPGVCNSQLTLPTALGGQAVFLARDPDHGAQIWTSDGTTAGTRRVTGLPAGTFAPASFAVGTAGRQLVFPATDSLHGEELWTAGGPALGGRLLADLVTAGYSSDPQHLTGAGNRLLFSTCDGRYGLWSTEGTPEPTVFLTPTSEVCLPSGETMPLTAAGSLVFFRKGSTLWRTDGTPAGTLSLGLDAAHLTAWNGLALFWHAGGLWTSDGSVEGARKAMDLPPEASSLSALAALGQELYLTSDQGLFHASGPTSTVAWVSPAPRVYGLPRFTRAGALVFFVAAGENGEHVWRTDGTLAGTFPLPAFASPGESQKIVDLAEYKGSLYFFVASDDGRILWRTDGTVAGTGIVHDFGNEYDPTLDRLPSSGLTVAAGRLFFTAWYGYELWTSDGTPEGTMRVAEVGPAGTGPVPTRPFGFTAAGGRAWFAAEDPDHGRELWSSDGTAAGTHLAQDIAPGVASSAPQQLTLAAGRLWLNADDGRTGRELWSLPLDSLECHAAPDRLCLQGGRFAVTLGWLDRAGQTQAGTARTVTGNTGVFWLDTPDSLELAVKIVDGRALNQSFWVFYGGLTDREYWITVTDGVTGLTRRYANPPGTLASAGDTRGFGPWGPFEPPPPALLERATAAARAAGACVPGTSRLCLNGGRFAVEATWRDSTGRSGAAIVMPLTATSGALSFANPESPELIVKLLDGRPVNGRFWFFSGALTNLEYTVTATDTVTGAVRSWHNPQGRFASVGDTEAFP